MNENKEFDIFVMILNQGNQRSFHNLEDRGDIAMNTDHRLIESAMVK
jgi:hypothetical protein